MDKKSLLIGQLGMHYDGYGFVVFEDKGAPDAFIPAHAIGDALHRDTVEVKLMKGRRGKMEGRIEQIVDRGLSQLVGRYEVRGNSAIVITDDFRVRRRIIIPRRKDGGARHNEMVIVKITKYPKEGSTIEGEVIKKLGKRGSDSTELMILVAKHQLPGDFDPIVEKEAGKISRQFDADDLNEREDITSLDFITIDGEDAKDFDDAVCGELLGDGSVRVWVAIADVSHFVSEGSVLDAEASARGTSTYLPGDCIPMLPEELSTNICSLLPGEKRYCFTAEMVIDPDGEIVKSRFYKSVIKSRYRMTYTEANDFLSNGKKVPAAETVFKSLNALDKAAFALRKRRSESGSIDFDLPEPEIVLDLTGRPENIVKADRNKAHMLVEDLMIAANVAVAEYLTDRRYPCVYRIHDRPDPEKLVELKMLLKYLGHKVSFGNDVAPGKMANVVRMVEGRPEEKLINMMLLRSLARAVYSTKNVGHFGLALSCYCHFTSPIRRYPDLLIHRLLSDAIGGQRSTKRREKGYLKLEAEKSSKLERRSMEAERESIDLYTAIFMRDKIGEVYEGMVSHTAKKGIFVELIDFFVEGMIRPEDLYDDEYMFDKNKFAYIGKETGKQLHIGDKITVKVRDVSVEERQVYFEPAD